MSPHGPLISVFDDMEPDVPTNGLDGPGTKGSQPLDSEKFASPIPASFARDDAGKRTAIIAMSAATTAIRFRWPMNSKG
jgi:hypothetical protein